METPVQIAFHNIEPSPAVKARVTERVEKLNHYHDRITACRVTIDSPHRHHHHGKIFQVRIDVTVPQGEIVVNREPEKDHGHEDVFVAIRDAFDAMQRQLQDHAREQRGDVKTHEASPSGHVARLFLDDGYGFITTYDEREIYFHRNAVVNGDFTHLKIGDSVEFVEQTGIEGPQASTVRACR